MSGSTDGASPERSLAPGLSPERSVALEVARACAERKALEIVILDVEGKLSYTDYLVIASGRSDRQVSAIGEGVARALRKFDPPRRPLGVEGERGGRWVLMDFGDCVLHVFHEDARMFYDLERLWHDCVRVDPDTGLDFPTASASTEASP